MSWNTVEMAQLIGAHSQRNPDIGVHFRRRAPGECFKNIVELCLPPERTENDLGGEPCVAGVKTSAEFNQQIGGIASVLDALEDREGHAPGG